MHKLEAAVIEHLGQYSDPVQVRTLLDAASKRELKQAESELARVQRRLEHIEGEFLKHLDLLKRAVINEQEFAKANAARREEMEQPEARRGELIGIVTRGKQTAEQVERLPKMVGSFLENFQAMDIRRQKAELQRILKAVHVYQDRVELEFRV